ncbi:phosphoethanolamine transferase [Undibacterium parvum]|uniref:Phosphoethanolamine transferase n=1 Tax=Undibacterium parvum TaxID=401471 RepID=A0A3S9HHK6_9BURK|nr:phosphoethanolamine transferase [Undibacterium parvum]
MQAKHLLIRIYIVLSYLGISACSVFSYFAGGTLSALIERLLFQALAWFALWSILLRPSVFHAILLPAFLAFPLELYLRFYFNQGISAHHLGVMFETSPKEAAEFLGYKIWRLGFALIFSCLWWYSILRLSRQDRLLSWPRRGRWPIFACSLIGLGFFIYIKQLTAESSAPTPSLQVFWNNYLKPTATSDTSAESSAYYRWQTYAQAWPFGIWVLAHEFYRERAYLSQLRKQNRSFLFHSEQSNNSSSMQTFVLVIGESSRYDRWGINGYARDTTPLLAQESNLVSFSDVISAVAATRLSIPIILSRKAARQSLQAGFSESSLISAFREAGFKTFWLSNQMSFGEFDTPTSVFANEAEVKQFLNLGGFTNTSSHDEILLEPLQIALRDNAEKKLIVLHSLGNHWNYSQRYPKQFDHWQPSLYGVSNPAYTDLKNKLPLNNSYDNSMLYTDWWLSQVIAQLKATKEMSALLYVSDHGQTLYDGHCRLAFHGHNTQYEFHIPAFMWFSSAYQERHPEQIKQLHLHRDARLSTENVFHSMLNMADIRYPDDKLEWSFLSAEYRPHRRYVDSYGWTDYDNAYFRGDCRELIDKQAPLSQEK